MNNICALIGSILMAVAASTVASAQDKPPQPMGSGQIVKKLSKDVMLARPGEPALAVPSVDLQVQFAFDSAELLPAGKRQLDELGRALNDKALASWGFELGGHTDQVGNADYNMRLSRERANTVKNYLMVNHGLNPQRLIPLGFGFSRLSDPGHPTASINRRVEVRRVALRVDNGEGSAATVAAPPGRSGGRIVPVQ